MGDALMQVLDIAEQIQAGDGATAATTAPGALGPSASAAAATPAPAPGASAAPGSATDSPTGEPLVAAILLSDGANSVGEADPLSAAERAATLGVPIYTIALGTANGQVQVEDHSGQPVTARRAAGHQDPRPDRRDHRGDRVRRPDRQGPVRPSTTTCSRGSAHERGAGGHVWFAAAARSVLVGAGLSAVWFGASLTGGSERPLPEAPTARPSDWARDARRAPRLHRRQYRRSPPRRSCRRSQLRSGGMSMPLWEAAAWPMNGRPCPHRTGRGRGRADRRWLATSSTTRTCSRPARRRHRHAAAASWPSPRPGRGGGRYAIDIDRSRSRPAGSTPRQRGCRPLDAIEESDPMAPTTAGTSCWSATSGTSPSSRPDGAVAAGARRARSARADRRPRSGPPAGGRP